MKELYIGPGSELQNVIHSFYCYTADADSAGTLKSIVPNLEMLLILNFGKPFPVSFDEKKAKKKTIEKCAVVGPLRKRFDYEILPGADVIVINFVLDGFFRLFKMDLSKFKGNILLCDDALIHSTLFAELWEIAKPLRDTHSRVRQLQTYMAKLSKESEATKLGLIFKEKSSPKLVINTLYNVPDDSLVSNRTIQMNFKKYFGYSVKEKIRYERFKNMVSFLLGKPDASVQWQEIIDRFSYYDYSHLSRDFKKFLSKTPQQFLSEAAAFCVPGLE